MRASRPIPQLFATNTLVIVMPAGNPGGVEDLSDLADDSVTVVLCAPEVPCGAASQTLLSNAGADRDAREPRAERDGRPHEGRRGRGRRGTRLRDRRPRPHDVESIVPEGAADVVNRYPIVALTDSANPEAAEAFVAFVLSDAGQEVLASLGFGAP